MITQKLFGVLSQNSQIFAQVFCAIITHHFIHVRILESIWSTWVTKTLEGIINNYSS